MKNSKNIIILTLIASVFLAFISGFIAYKITTNNTNDSFLVGDYSLKYGTYKGYSIEYDWDEENQEMIESSKDELILKLNDDNTYELSGEKHKFSVVGSDIIVPDFDNIVMFEAVGNDTIQILIGAGVELTYCGE